MLRKIFVCCFVWSTCLIMGLDQVRADSIAIQANRDNSIYQDAPGNSNGSGSFFFAGNNGGGFARRGLLSFDISAIPTNAVVQNVTVTLFMSQTSGGDADVRLHRLLADWGESTSDAPGGEGGGTAAEVGDATWDHTFFNTQFWANPGGDFDAVGSATTTVGGVGSYSWSSPGLISDVQGWINGSSSNFGWILVGDELTSSTSKRFNSRHEATNTPLLNVEFTVIPEPCSALLGCSFVLGLAVRRVRKL